MLVKQVLTRFKHGGMGYRFSDMSWDDSESVLKPINSFTLLSKKPPAPKKVPKKSSPTHGVTDAKRKQFAASAIALSIGNERQLAMRKREDDQRLLALKRSILLKRKGLSVRKKTSSIIESNDVANFRHCSMDLFGVFRWIELKNIGPSLFSAPTDRKLRKMPG